MKYTKNRSTSWNHKQEFLGFEVYGAFGRRIKLFEDDGTLSVLKSNEACAYARKLQAQGVKCWIRHVYAYIYN